VSDPAQAAADASLRHEVEADTPDPLSRLRGEHALLLEWARHVEFVLSHRALDERGRTSLEDHMRTLRDLLPRHALVEEQALFAEVALAEPRSLAALSELHQMRMRLEQAFGKLQGLALVRAVYPEGGRAQRRAMQAARDFREKLEAIIVAKEEGPFAAAARALSPEAMAQVAAALDAAAFRDRLKRLQVR
jgi:hypothetical protein